MTKPTYSELEAELLRVRGLLQRQSVRVEMLENLLRGGLAYADGGWDSKEWKALVADALSQRNGSSVSSIIEADNAPHGLDCLCDFCMER